MNDLITYSEKNLHTFLALNSNDPKSIEHGFSFTHGYLINLREMNFNHIAVTPLTIFLKYTALIKYYTETLHEEILNACHDLSAAMKGDFGFDICSERHGTLYELTTASYTMAKEIQSSASNDNSFEFLSIDNANKYNALRCLYEARKLISEDSCLNDKAKRSLLKLLDRIIKDLESEKSNHLNAFGKLREVIIILGALGSTLGGIAGVDALLSAKDKVEEAHIIIEQTVVSNNFQISIINNYLTKETKDTLLTPALEAKRESAKALPPPTETEDETI